MTARPDFYLGVGIENCWMAQADPRIHPGKRPLDVFLATVQWDYRDNNKTVAECIRPGGWNNGLYTIAPQPDGSLRRVKTAAVDAYASLLRRLASGRAQA